MKMLVHRPIQFGSSFSGTVEASGACVVVPTGDVICTDERVVCPTVVVGASVVETPPTVVSIPLPSILLGGKVVRAVVEPEDENISPVVITACVAVTVVDELGTPPVVVARAVVGGAVVDREVEELDSCVVVIVGVVSLFSKVLQMLFTTSQRFEGQSLSPNRKHGASSPAVKH